MSTLEILRKQYDNLQAFERAVMFLEAVNRRDESAIDALAAPSLREAYHAHEYERLFTQIAFYAVHQSQTADSLHWLGIAGSFVTQGNEERTGKANPANDERLNRFAQHCEEGTRRRVAWLLALHVLDEETGGACMKAARIVAGAYIDQMLEDADGYGMKIDIQDITQELAVLRQMWTAGTQNAPDAPKVAEGQ